MTHRIRGLSIQLFDMKSTATVLVSRLLVRARLRHLHVLSKVAELRSIQRAAAAVGLTQPSTTHVLADLEQLVGCRLFDRHARGVTPTAVTVELLPLVKRILESVNECASVIAAVSSDARGVVQVAAITGAINGLLAPVLPQFSRQHPDILVNVLEVDIAQIGAVLARGSADVIYCREPSVLPQGWVFQPLLEDRLIVVSGPQHPLAKRKRIGINDLWPETWLQGPVDSAPRQALDLLASEGNHSPHYRLVSSRSISVLVSMLQRDRLVSLIPQSITRPLIEARQVIALPVTFPAPFKPIGALRPVQMRGEASTTFVEFISSRATTPYEAASSRGSAESRCKAST